MSVIILGPKNGTGYKTDKSLPSWHREQILPMSSAKIRCEGKKTHTQKKEKER